MKNKLTILLALILIAVSAFVIVNNVNKEETSEERNVSTSVVSNKVEVKDNSIQTPSSNNTKKEGYSFYENDQISFYYRTEDETCLSVFGNFVDEEISKTYKMCIGGSIGNIESTSSLQSRLSRIMFMKDDVLEAKELGIEDTCYPYKTRQTSNGYNVFYFENADFKDIDSYDVNEYGKKCSHNPTTSEYGPLNLYLLIDESGANYIEISWGQDTAGAWEVINSLKFKNN